MFAPIYNLSNIVLKYLTPLPAFDIIKHNHFVSSLGDMLLVCVCLVA